MKIRNKNFFQLWGINALLLFLVSLFIKGMVLKGLWAILGAGLVFALVGILVRPLLYLISLPVNILTLGLFTFVLNALMISLTAKLVPGFTLSGFGAAFWGAILMSIFGALLRRFFYDGPNGAARIRI